MSDEKPLETETTAATSRGAPTEDAGRSPPFSDESAPVRRFDPAGIGKGHMVVFASDYDALADRLAAANGERDGYRQACDDAGRRIAEVQRDLDTWKRNANAYMASLIAELMHYTAGTPHPAEAELKVARELISDWAGVNCYHYTRHLTRGPCGICCSCQARAFLEATETKP